MKNQYESVTDKQLPEVFAKHQDGCAGCLKWDQGRPATLANVCVEGAPMVKRLLEIAARPAVSARRRAEREQAEAQGLLRHKASKEQLRNVTRYKGE